MPLLSPIDNPPQTRDIEAELLPTARELGVAIVAYSPLGRGFLSRTFTKKEELVEADWRNQQPRFQVGPFGSAGGQGGLLYMRMAVCCVACEGIVFRGPHPY